MMPSIKRAATGVLLCASVLLPAGCLGTPDWFAPPTEILEAEPPRTSWQKALLARRACEAGRYESARQLADESLAADDATADDRRRAYLWRGRALEGLGDHLAAAQDLADAIARSSGPDKAELHVECARAWRAAGKLAQAETHYDAVADTDPVDRRVGSLWYQARVERGNVRIARGALDDAEEDFACLARLYADDPVVRRGLREVQLRRAQSSLDRGDYDRAIEDLAAVEDEHDARVDDARARVLLARARQFLGHAEYEKAVADSEAALAIQPDNADVQQLHALAVKTLERATLEIDQPKTMQLEDGDPLRGDEITGVIRADGCFVDWYRFESTVGRPIIIRLEPAANSVMVRPQLGVIDPAGEVHVHDFQLAECDASELIFPRPLRGTWRIGVAWQTWVVEARTPEDVDTTHLVTNYTIGVSQYYARTGADVLQPNEPYRDDLGPDEPGCSPYGDKSSGLTGWYAEDYGLEKSYTYHALAGEHFEVTLMSSYPRVMLEAYAPGSELAEEVDGDIEPGCAAHVLVDSTRAGRWRIACRLYGYANEQKNATLRLPEAEVCLLVHSAMVPQGGNRPGSVNDRQVVVGRLNQNEHDRRWHEFTLKNKKESVSLTMISRDGVPDVQIETPNGEIIEMAVMTVSSLLEERAHQVEFQTFYFDYPGTYRIGCATTCGTLFSHTDRPRYHLIAATSANRSGAPWVTANYIDSGTSPTWRGVNTDIRAPWIEMDRPFRVEPNEDQQDFHCYYQAEKGETFWVVITLDGPISADSDALELGVHSSSTLAREIVDTDGWTGGARVLVQNSDSDNYHIHISQVLDPPRPFTLLITRQLDAGITIEEPKDGADLGETDRVKVSGRVEGTIDSVLVRTGYDEIEVPVIDGRFSTTVAVGGGENPVEVIPQHTAWNGGISATVRATAPEVAITIDDPDPGGFLRVGTHNAIGACHWVRGTITDERISEVLVTINGDTRTVPVQRTPAGEGEFRTKMDVVRGPNTVVVTPPPGRYRGRAEVMFTGGDIETHLDLVKPTDWVDTGERGQQQHPIVVTAIYRGVTRIRIRVNGGYAFTITRPERGDEDHDPPFRGEVTLRQGMNTITVEVQTPGFLGTRTWSIRCGSH